mgnify:CR=1 FL=1
MTTVLIIAAVTCVLLMVVAFLKPSVTIKNATVPIFWVVPFLGAVAMIPEDKVDPNWSLKLSYICSAFE